MGHKEDIEKTCKELEYMTDVLKLNSKPDFTERLNALAAKKAYSTNSKLFTESRASERVRNGFIKIEG